MPPSVSLDLASPRPKCLADALAQPSPPAPLVRRSQRMERPTAGVLDLTIRDGERPREPKHLSKTGLPWMLPLPKRKVLQKPETSTLASAPATWMGNWDLPRKPTEIAFSTHAKHPPSALNCPPSSA